MALFMILVFLCETEKYQFQCIDQKMSKGSND